MRYAHLYFTFPGFLGTIDASTKGGSEMARTYIPTLLVLNHILAVYVTKNNSKLQVSLPPSAILAYNALYQCILAFDALRQALEDVEP